MKMLRYKLLYLSHVIMALLSQLYLTFHDLKKEFFGDAWMFYIVHVLKRIAIDFLPLSSSLFCVLKILGRLLD